MPLFSVKYNTTVPGAGLQLPRYRPLQSPWYLRPLLKLN